MIRRPATTGTLLAAVAFALAAGPGRADSKEDSSAEARLRRAGVPAALEGRILASLERAGGWLAARMGPDGSFASKGDLTWLFGPDHAGLTPLCGLALECAGRRDAAGRAIRWFCPDGESLRRDVMGHVYAAGLALRLLREHGGNEGPAELLARNLAAMADPGTGWWAYRWTPPGVPYGTLPNAPSAPAPAAPDLAASRFAVEGLAAAEAGAWRAPAALWGRHLDGLVGSQRPDGAFPFQPGQQDGDGTLPGIACLVLGRDALLRRGKVPASTERALGDALLAARAALREEEERILATPRGSAAGNPWACFALHDLAAAAAAADDGAGSGMRTWTSIAGDFLSCQGGDGSWEGGFPPDDLVATSYAVLALSRAFDSLRPGAPPPSRPAPAAPPAWPDPGALPPAGRIPIGDAADALSLLEGALRDPAASPSAVASAVRLVGRCQGRLGPAGPAGPLAEEEALAWHLRAEEALLRALASGRRDGAEAARLAATLLRYAHPRVVPALRRALEESVLPADPDPRVLRAAFGALAAHGGRESAEWLLAEALSTESTGPRAARSVEALRAIPAFGGLARADRRALAERIVAAFEGIEGAAPLRAGDRGHLPGAAERWAFYRRPVLEALAALGIDPDTGAVATDGRGLPVRTVRGWRQWLRDGGEGRRAGGR